MYIHRLSEIISLSLVAPTNSRYIVNLFLTIEPSKTFATVSEANIKLSAMTLRIFTVNSN